MDKEHVKERQLKIDNFLVIKLHKNIIIQIIKFIMIASQNYINDFNHRFIVVHHFSAKF